MYNRLKIENIKTFEKKQELKIAPITLIYGENSSGKTTLLKNFLIFMKKKEPKQNGLTMKQIEGYLKKAKGGKKFYWMGRKDSLKGSLRYKEWLKSKKSK